MKSESHYDGYNSFLKSKFYNLNKKEYDQFNNYFEKNYGKNLPLNKNCKILDIGCGLGHFIVFLRKKGYKDINGIDLEVENVKYCQSLGFDNIKKANMYDYLKDCREKYDLIVLNDVIEHVPKDRLIDFVQDINSKLSKNGILIIRSCNCNNKYGLSSFFADLTHEVGFTKEKIIQLAYMTNFDNVQLYNKYLYTNIYVIDFIVNTFRRVFYKGETILFLANGRKDNDVHSKNLLAILKKRS